MLELEFTDSLRYVLESYVGRVSYGRLFAPNVVTLGRKSNKKKLMLQNKWQKKVILNTRAYKLCGYSFEENSSLLLEAKKLIKAVLAVTSK